MERKGSVTIEMALLLPVLILTLLFFLWLFQLLCLQNCLEHAVMRASSDLRKYAVIYHEYGVAKVEGKLLEALDDERAVSFVSLRGLSQEGKEYLYTEAVEALVEYYLSQDSLIDKGYLQYEDLSCSGSVFFAGNEDIELHVRCTTAHVAVGTSVRFRGWIRGDQPIASITESGVSVWSFDNFTRGKILRDIFGGDLPYDYPTIASFKEGTALMIKSIDITKSTYESGKKLASEVRNMIEKLSAFHGTEGDSGVDPSLWISEGEIQTRKLLLVLPENPMSPVQSRALLEVLQSDAIFKHVQVEIQLYQTVDDG